MMYEIKWEVLNCEGSKIVNEKSFCKNQATIFVVVSKFAESPLIGMGKVH